MNSKIADNTGDQGFLSNIGSKLQDMAGAAAEKLSTTTNGGRDLMQPSMNDTQQKTEQSFHSEYKTNNGHNTGKEACVAAQNNPTPFEGKCCPEHDRDEAKDYGKRVFM